MIGHQWILDFFDRAILNDRLAHAYLFVGPAHVGKRTAAEMVAAKLLGVFREKLGIHPDATIVERGTDEKTGARKKDIVAEQIHALCSRLSQSALLGGYRVALVAEAEDMNAVAANALLKTLEEPCARTVLFLTAVDAGELPQTIVSRCQTLRFAAVSESAITEGLVSRGIARDRADALARESRGVVGRAIAWAEDPSLFASHEEAGEQFLALWGEPFYKKLAAVEALFGDKKDHIAARDRLQETLCAWEVITRDRLLAATESREAARLVGIAGAIHKAREWMGENVHPRLLVEHVLLEIP